MTRLLISFLGLLALLAVGWIVYTWGGDSRTVAPDAGRVTGGVERPPVDLQSTATETLRKLGKEKLALEHLERALACRVVRRPKPMMP